MDFSSVSGVELVGDHWVDLQQLSMQFFTGVLGEVIKDLLVKQGVVLLRVWLLVFEEQGLDVVIGAPNNDGDFVV